MSIICPLDMTVNKRDKRTLFVQNTNSAPCLMNFFYEHRINTIVRFMFFVYNETLCTEYEPELYKFYQCYEYGNWVYWGVIK